MGVGGVGVMGKGCGRRGVKGLGWLREGDMLRVCVASGERGVAWAVSMARANEQGSGTG